MKPERYLGQQTVSRSVAFVGVGLHTGQRVSMLIHPGAADTGIVFVRADVSGSRGRIPASWERVVDTSLCTVIGNEHGVTVSTVEHLMAALYGCRVDNAVVEINGPEVPILDGSAAPLVQLIRRVGTTAQNAPRRAVRVLAPVSISHGDRWARLHPGAGSSVSVQIAFGAPAVGRQAFTLDLAGDGFDREVSRARTFGFLRDVEQLRERGLAAGGSLANAIIVDEDRILNSEGLRYHDEFARHKTLDCVGDLYLAGAPVLGHLHSYKPGHALNHALLRQLMSLHDAWEWVDLLAPGASIPGARRAAWRRGNRPAAATGKHPASDTQIRLPGCRDRVERTGRE